MSDRTISATDAPAPVRPSAASASAAATRPAEVAAHLVAALVVGSVAPFLVLWTSPSYAFGVAPDGFELVDIMPQLVALLALGVALLARVRGFVWLRSAGWLVAAAGLLGLAGLYAQGTALDGQTLTIALVVVIALQIVGLLFAFARAGGVARWTVALGLAAGIAGGREAVALLVGAVRDGLLAGGMHGDDVVFAGLGVLVAAAGVVSLVLGRGGDAYEAAGRWPAQWWAFVRWPVAALAGASVLAVVLTRLWNARLDTIAQSYIGGISEQDSLAVQTQDQLVRVGIAVLLTAVLVVAAYRSGGAGVARWVVVAFGVALVLVGLEGFGVYAPSWPTALLAVTGAVGGAVVVHRVDRVLPWEALGLLLASALLFTDAPGVAGYLGAFGLGLATAAGILRLAPLPPSVGGGGRMSAVRLGPGGVSVAAGIGLAVWVFSHQVVVPATAVSRSDLGGVPILPFGVTLAAAAAVAFFFLSQRPSKIQLRGQDPAEQRESDRSGTPAGE